MVVRELVGGETWDFPLLRADQNLCLDLVSLRKCDEHDRILVNGRNLHSVNCGDFVSSCRTNLCLDVLRQNRISLILKAAMVASDLVDPWLAG